MDKKQQERFRDRLQKRLGELDGEVSGKEAERAEALAMARDEVEDSGDEAEAKRDDEVRNAEEDRDRNESTQIVAALARIADGSYGSCIDCDADIPVARLEAQPTAARCIPCQEKFEKREALGMTSADPYFAASVHE